MLAEEIRILIAEDEYFVCEEIKRALDGSRYNIIGEADNGEEVVTMAAALNPDLILMDIKMPRMDGLEASRRINTRCACPIVILTAYDSPDLLEEASKVGVGAFLAKPPRYGEIDRAATIAMARHRDLMEIRRLNVELQRALSEVKVLSGLLPICSCCKKIRDDKGYWNQLEVYLKAHSEAEFSHSICPVCARKLYPDLDVDFD